jgi:putative oxidoreductase
MTIRIAYTIIRFLFGGLFLWSGIAKAYDPAGFALDIRNYELIGDPWVAMAALFLPWLEIVTGVLLMGGWKWGTRGSSGILWASLIVFTIAIAISWARGLDIACGCFGIGGESTNYPVKITQNVILIGIASWIWWFETRGSNMRPADSAG